MAIAVAACFPWGPLGQALRSLGPGVPFDKGIVLATDSQLYVVDDQAADEGRGVYVLEENAALVFSGDVETGELAVGELMDYISNQRSNPSVDMPRVTQHFLKLAAEHVPRRRKQDRLNVMVGNYDAEPGRASVVVLTEDDGFVPKQAQGVFVCGDEQVAVAFGQALMALAAERTEVQNAEDWQTDMAMAMRMALENCEDTYSIGGTVQTLRMDTSGLNQSGFSYTTADPFDSSTWQVRPPGARPARKNILARVMD